MSNRDDKRDKAFKAFEEWWAENGGDCLSKMHHTPRAFAPKRYAYQFCCIIWAAAKAEHEPKPVVSKLTFTCPECGSGLGFQNAGVCPECRTNITNSIDLKKEGPAKEGGETIEGGVSSAGDTVHRERSAPEETLIPSLKSELPNMEWKGDCPRCGCALIRWGDEKSTKCTICDYMDVL